MSWVWQTLGCLIVAAAMYDVFHVIFHPTESGTNQTIHTLAKERLREPE